VLAFYGEALGVRIARKHLGWYLDAAVADGATDPEAARALRRPLLTAERPAEGRALVERAFVAPLRSAA